MMFSKATSTIVNTSSSLLSRWHQQQQRCLSSLLVASSSQNNSLRRKQTAVADGGCIRNLNVHEYISMELMKLHGVKVPDCYVAHSAYEAQTIFAQTINNPKNGNDKLKDVVMKAQVLSGGRGLGKFDNGFAGGVHMVTSGEQAKEYAEKMIGAKLITKQAPNGIVCNQLLLTERLYLRKEMYLSILMDRVSQGPLMVASPKGGTSIEDVAKTNPEFIYTEAIDIMDGLQESQCVRMAINLGLPKGTEQHKQAVTMMKNLYNMFITCDCTQVEINPLAETIDGDIVACDAKVNFDDNAAYRQSTIFSRRDISQEDPREVNASHYDLNYIGLDGNIGCMVNGAGLAMSTMDIISLKGASPANFLDVGGGANEHQVEKAFEILNDDAFVKVILVNIFGGIMRCDTIANGIVNAARNIGMNKPVVIRLQGTNVQEARAVIEQSGYNGLILATDLEDAAQKAVGIAKIIAVAETMNVDVRFVPK